MKNIHVLPTDKPSKLFYNVGGALLFTKWDNYNGVNIYITSDEEIKEGDWVLFISTNEVIKVPLGGFKGKVCKKIILTTDRDLIKDGVQAIDDDFLEWFVNNPSCEEVEVMKMFNMIQLTSREYIYYIIIPKEEPKQETQGYICPSTKKQCDDECCVSAKDCHLEASMGVLSEPKQETLEEAARNYRDLKLPDDLYDAFIAGAKWQQDNSNINALYFEIDALKREVKRLNYENKKLTETFNKYDMEKTNDELIESIVVNESNFNYIAKTGKINGSLLIDIRRILDEKANPIKDRKCYIQQKLDEANELLYENGIKERPYIIDNRGA